MGTLAIFRFRVVVALSRVLLHARNVVVAQVVLGPSCCRIQPSRFRDTPEDDDTEFFVMAWCCHPSLIEREKPIFIPEAPTPGILEANPRSAPGMRYPVRIRIVAVQDRNTPPGSPAAGGVVVVMEMMMMVVMVVMMLIG